MKLLAWDTSSKFGSIAALDWTPGRDLSPRLVAEWSLGLEASHSDRLLWAVHQILQASRWTLEEVDYLGVGVGPGSFTGIRIGVTTARSLALATGKPLVGVSSLAALARGAAQFYAQSEKRTRVLVVGATDACKGEVFGLTGLASSVRDCVSHADSGNGAFWKRGVEEGLFRPEELKALIGKQAKSKRIDAICMVGEARERYRDTWNPIFEKIQELVPMITSAQDYVQGRAVALLAWEAVQAGLAKSAAEIRPRYLRASDAEVKLRARQSANGNH